MRRKLSHVASFTNVDTPVNKTEQDRHLIKRNKRYYYRRRVPKAAEVLDDRTPSLWASALTRWQ